MDQKNTLGNELSQDARAVLQQVALKGIKEYNQVLSVILESEGDRSFVAKKIAQKLATGNQQMAVCLALLEPLKVKSVLAGIHGHLESYLEQLGGSSGFVGALESLEEQHRQTHTNELLERVKNLEAESKQQLF